MALRNYIPCTIILLLYAYIITYAVKSAIYIHYHLDSKNVEESIDSAFHDSN